MRRPRTQRVATEEIERSIPLTPDQIRRRTFARAVKLLSAKPRSIAELRERLMAGKRTTETAVDEVMARLSEYGYLDDEKFAFGYASAKLRQRPIGRERLKRDLMFKKVSRAVADEALELVFVETSEEELIDRALEKRTRVRGRPRTREDAKKLFDHLLRQGFPCELVSEKVRAALQTEIADEDLQNREF